jgi:Ca2+/Na+ antiporter
MDTLIFQIKPSWYDNSLDSFYIWMICIIICILYLYYLYLKKIQKKNSKQDSITYIPKIPDINDSEFEQKVVYYIKERCQNLAYPHDPFTKTAEELKSYITNENIYNILISAESYLYNWKSFEIIRREDILKNLVHTIQ